MRARAWVSGPEDLQNAETKGEYFWGYPNMTTVKGLFAAGECAAGLHGANRLGGNSLLAAEMLARARVMFGIGADCVQPLTRCLLRDPTLRSFSEATQAARAGSVDMGHASGMVL
mgnify:CR=1 FL=1